MSILEYLVPNAPIKCDKDQKFKSWKALSVKLNPSPLLKKTPNYFWKSVFNIKK